MKKFQWVSVLSSVLALAISTGASAADLFTSSLLVEPGQVVNCSAVNNATAAQNITVELFDRGGSSIFGPQNCTFVKPRGICRQLATIPTGSDEVVMCRITVGRKSTVRGLIANDTNGNSSPAS
jgi:hypothetical protein